jgi:hypothetical protein
MHHMAGAVMKKLIGNDRYLIQSALMQGDFHRKKPTYVATNSSSDYLPTTCNLH